MPGLGTIVNIGAVLLGSAVGLLFRRMIPEKLKATLMQALALSTLCVGLTGTISGALEIAEGGLSSRYTLMMILSMVIGTLIGETIDIEHQLDRFGAFCQKKLVHSDTSTFAEGFVTASLVYCVGSMAIVGSLNDGILHKPDILFAKSALDGVISIVFASTLGIGVMFSILSVALYQGSLTAAAALLSPFLTDAVITQMSFIGSLLILGIGFNFIYKPHLKVGNMLPAMFVPLVWYVIQSIVGVI